MDNKKILVAYFSCSGATRSAAQALAAELGADLHEIQPEIPYTAEDLNWNDRGSRSSLEMRDPSSRPAIANRVADMASYDALFVGFPVWWYIAPTIINTFLEGYDLAGKSVIPFATSGGSGIANCEKHLRQDYPSIQWGNGRLLNGRSSRNNLSAWIKELGLK